MKPQQLAKLLNLSPHTIRKWAREDFTEYLSPTGQGGGGVHRSFSEIDSRILAWIALMKAQNMPLQEIHLALKTAQENDWRNLPPLPGGMANDEPIAVVPREAVEERIRAIQERYETQLQIISKERNDLQTKLNSIEKEREQERQQANEALKAAQQESAETVKVLQREHTENIRAIQQRIIDLTAQEAELRGKLEQYVIGGHRRSAVTLVVTASIVGAVIAVIGLIVILIVAAQLSGTR